MHPCALAVPVVLELPTAVLQAHKATQALRQSAGATGNSRIQRAKLDFNFRNFKVAKGGRES